MKIKNKPILFIFLILIFHGINNYVWLKIDQRPVIDDSALHLLGGFQIAQLLNNCSWPNFVQLINFSVACFYPPFFHFCLAIFNIFFGKSLVSSVMTNFIFLSILAFSLFYIGKKIGDKNIGVLSFFIVSMYPFVFGLSRIALPDFALTAMVTFSLCCLIYTDNFAKRVFSLLFGLSLGIGMLTKQVFIFFIITPFIFVIIKIFIKKEMDKQKAKNLFICFLAAFLSGGYWYVLNFQKILPNYLRAGYSDAVMFGPASIFSLGSVTYYFYQLLANQMLVFFCIVFAVGAGIFFCSKTKFKLLLLFSAVGAYIIFTFLIQTKEAKTTVPYLPIFAVISAAGILNLRPGGLKFIFITLITVFGLYQYFVISYNFIPNRMTSLPLVSLLLPQHNLEPIISYHHFASADDWELHEVLSLIEIQEKNGKKICGVSGQDAALMRAKGIPWANSYIITNDYGTKYYCRRKGLSSRIVSLNDKSLSGPWWEDKRFSPDTLILVDVLEKQVPGYVAQKYRLFKILTLPDGSFVYTYTKNDD